MKTEQYCEKFSDFFGAQSAFAFWKGRVALYAILKALGVTDGDEVILPGYTCVMDVNPIKYCRAKPVYVDIEPDTFNMNVELLEDKITPNTKVIIAQHTYGYPCDMDAIMKIAENKGITVIEDCCLAFGSKYKGKTLGTFGKAAYFSSQWNKSFTTGLGGMAICNDESLADKISHICKNELQNVPYKKAALLAIQRGVYRAVVYPKTALAIRRFYRFLISKGLVIGSSSVEEKEKTDMPENFFMAMSPSQASSGIRQLGSIEKNIEHRKKMAAIYNKSLQELGWPVIQTPEFTDPVLVRYPVRVTNKWQMVADAIKHGIELGTWFESPLHPKDTKLELYGYNSGMCPQAEKAAKEVVNLPLHPRTSEKTIHRTIEFVTLYEPVK